MGFIAMVVPVGTWRLTSQPDEAWTQAALSIMTRREYFDDVPNATMLVASYQTRLDCLTEQLRDEQHKQSRASGFVHAVQHFELYLFNEIDAPTHEEFMFFLNGSGRLSPLSHIRFDWNVAMPVRVPQPS